MIKNFVTVSTLFTLLRIALTPWIVVAMIQHNWVLAFLLFIVAAITDAFDGFLARLCNQQTYFGAVLDPLADKFLIISCFAALAFVDSPLFSIPQWFVFFVIIKELLLMIGVAFLFWTLGSLPIKPTLLSKATTVCQIVVIMWVFACYFFDWIPIKTYYCLLGILFFMVLATFVQYLFIGYRYLFD